MLAPISHHNNYQLLIFVAIISYTTYEVMRPRCVELVDRVAIGELVERLLRVAAFIVLLAYAQDRVVIR